MTLFSSFFRGGRTTPTPRATPTPTGASPTPVPTSRPEPPSTPRSTTSRAAPPSAYRTIPTPSAPSAPSAPRSHPSPTPIKVRDFALPSTPDVSRRLPDLPLPPTPDTSSASSRHARAASNASTTPKRGAKPPPKPTHPPTAFTPPRQHQRAQSGPSPSTTSKTDMRARSATLQTLSSAAQPRGVSQPENALTLPRLVPFQPASAAPGRSSEPKRRPVALILRRSNLTPPDPLSRSKPLPQLLPEAPTGKTPNATAQTHQDSRGSCEEPASEHARGPQLPEGPSGPKPPLKRPSGLADASRTAMRGATEWSVVGSTAPLPVKRDEAVHAVPPPAPKSPYPQTTPAGSPTPRSASHTPLHMFPQIPLPWTSSSASQLSRELGQRFDSLVEYTLDHLPPSSPRILRPSVLKTSAAEDARLRAELVKLQEKHTALVGHRDGLLASLAALDYHGDEGDQVKETVFICSDQIRQIEVQGEEHVVGALRIALERAQEGSSRSSDTASNTTRAQHLGAVDRRVGCAPPDNGGSWEKDWDGGNRMSTATNISLNQLGFPLPPVRSSPSPSGSSVTLALPRLADGALRHHDPPETTRSASTSQLEVTVDPADEILIYPPGHRRSSSAPLLGLPDFDVPHTPWRGGHDSTAAIGTRPLRFKAGGRRAVGKAKSLAHKRRSSDTLRRVRRGRESQLEAPGSILLSLATAGLWTKREAGDGLAQHF